MTERSSNTPIPFRSSCFLTRSRDTQILNLLSKPISFSNEFAHLLPHKITIFPYKAITSPPSVMHLYFSGLGEGYRPYTQCFYMHVLKVQLIQQISCSSEKATLPAAIPYFHTFWYQSKGTVFPQRKLGF